MKFAASDKANPANVAKVANAVSQSSSVRFLAAAPHRMYFFTGTLLLILSLCWWAWDVAARFLPLSYPLLASMVTPWQVPVPPGWLHAIVLIYGPLPAYIFGFALTAMPRWLNRPAVSGAACVSSGLLQIAGGIAMLMGFVTGGLGLLLAAWTIALKLIFRRVYRGPHPDKRHATLLVAGLSLGWCGLLLALLGAWSGTDWQQRAAIILGLWGMLLPVNLVVAHRMLPFFTANAIPDRTAWQPFIPLYILLAASCGYGIAAELRWSLAAALLAAVAALMTGMFAWRWQVNGLFRNRLLMMLHVSHAWLPLAFAGAVVQQAAQFLGYSILGNAPLHALTLGFLLSTVVAMVSRVSLGHSGRHVSADKVTWWIFWLLQVFAAIRVVADVITLPTRLPHAYFVAAIGVAVVAIAWGWRYLPLYVKARADGMPG